MRAFLAALVVPPKCLACGRATAPDASVCVGCRAAIDLLPTGTISPALGSQFNQSFAAFPYEGPVRELVRALKYRSAVAAAREIAALTVERVPVSLLAGALLVPVPAHPARRRSRGFNQAALIARELAAICELSVWDCLVRDRTRPAQSTLSRAQRLTLPPSSIRMNPRFLADRTSTRARDFPTNVVVLDDVTTTGVTLEVCASAIRERCLSDQRLNDQLAIGVLTFASTSAHPRKSIDRNFKTG